MKKFILFGLALALCLSLCACGEDDIISTNPGTQPGTEATTADPTTGTEGADATEATTGTTEPAHEHSYTQVVTAPDCTNGGYTTNTCQCGDSYVSDEVAALGHTWTDATCNAPKTCSVCGTTEGEAAGHSYTQGACVRCGEAQEGYKALTAYGWRTAGLTPSGEELDVITLWFAGEESTISAGFYHSLDDLDKDLQDAFLSDPDSLVEHAGKKYFFMGFGDMRPMSHVEEGDTVVVSILEDKAIGTITMVRTGIDQYTVTEITGRIIDDTVTSCLAVGSVFTAVATE